MIFNNREMKFCLTFLRNRILYKLFSEFIIRHTVQKSVGFCQIILIFIVAGKSVYLNNIKLRILMRHYFLYCRFIMCCKHSCITKRITCKTTVIPR